jgi:6-phosphogluconolactonase
MWIVLIGSYGTVDQPGVSSCRYHAETGGLEVLDQVSGLLNPSFLAVNEVESTLYVLNELNDDKGRPCGGIAAYRIEDAGGQLTLINQELAAPAPICHIALDRTGQCVMVSSYQGGLVALSPVLEGGGIGTTADLHLHQGSSLLPVQNQPRAHSLTVDRDNRFAIVCDLGLDRIVVYRLDLVASRLLPHSVTAVAPGAGPRHFAFHPELPCGYVINELNATITMFAYDPVHGQLTEIQTVSTLPEDYHGENACAHIQCSPDGKFLYGSNRGHDSIVVHAIDPISGMLTPIEHVPTLGRHPRHFALSPDGRFLLVANQASDSIIVFSRDEYSGTLAPTGEQLETGSPVCIVFAAIGYNHFLQSI